MKTKLYWEIHTESNGSIFVRYANNELSEVNNNTRTGTAGFNFKLYSEEVTSLTVNGGETYTVSSGDVEAFTSVTVESNGTLNVDGVLLTETVNVKENGTLDVAQDAEINTGTIGGISTIQAYQEHAGSFSTVETLNNNVYYRNELPSGASITSLVVAIEPSQALKDNNVNGVWGIISGVSDTTNQAITNRTYRIDVTVLADYADYADHQAINNDLQT